METPNKQEVVLPPDIMKRMEAATTAEDRATVMKDFAKSLGAETDMAKKEAVALTDEQFRSFLEKVGQVSADGAKAMISAVASDTERMFGIEQGEARAMAEQSLLSEEKKMQNRRSDWEIAAKVFRGMFLAKEGKPDEYRRAIEEEAEYNKKRYGKVTRAMSLGTDSTGGYLAPQQFSDMLYEAIARQSLVRKYATIIPMNGNEVIKFPVLSTVPAGGAVAEGSGGTPLQPTFTQKQLDTQKLMTLSKPISVEMIEKANPAIIPLLLKFATIELMKAEDNLVFGTTGDGIRATATNEVTTGSAASGYSSIDFDDMAAMEGILDPQYTPDEDVQGSGLVSGMARFWIPHALRVALMVKKETGTGAYLDEARELRNNRKIFGYEAKRALSLPAAGPFATGDKVAVFGDLSYVWCGVEPDFRIKLLEEGSVDSTNLAETAQVALRVIEYFDNVVIDNEAFAQAKFAA